jgi:hypothetical protein
LTICFRNQLIFSIIPHNGRRLGMIAMKVLSTLSTSCFSVDDLQMSSQSVCRLKATKELICKPSPDNPPLWPVWGIFVQN